MHKTHKKRGPCDLRQKAQNPQNVPPLASSRSNATFSDGDSSTGSEARADNMSLSFCVPLLGKPGSSHSLTRMIEDETD